MTADAAHTLLATTLRTLALASGGYATPPLNDCLYAGGAGLGWVGGDGEGGGGENGSGDGDDHDGTARPSLPPPLYPALARYTALRALHLDRNGLSGDLGGWPCLPCLAALHLADNALVSLAGLTPGTVPALTLLDVSGNQLTSLDSIGKGVGPTLTCLRAARNPFCGGEEGGEQGDHDATPLAILSTASRLVTLDLAECGLSDGAALLTAVRALPALRCLAVGGNPGADVGRAFGCEMGGKPPTRRLALAAAAPALTYLDGAPVFGGERAAADAWAAGLGEAGAEAARTAWVESERARRAELQGGAGLTDGKLAAMRADKTCWVVEVPAKEEEEGGGESL